MSEKDDMVERVVSIPCPSCEGAGLTVGIRPTCCGRTYASGECKGDCVIPEQYQEECDICGGSGNISEIKIPAVLQEPRHD